MLKLPGYKFEKNISQINAKYGKFWSNMHSYIAFKFA